MFHVSLFKIYRKGFEEYFSSVLIKNEKQLKRKEILNNRVYYDKFQYFVK